MLPGFAGTDLDEMTFSHIVGIPAFITSFNWAAQGTGTLLYTADLGPLSSSLITTNTVSYNGFTTKTYDVPPLSYFAPMFNVEVARWSGGGGGR